MPYPNQVVPRLAPSPFAPGLLCALPAFVRRRLRALEDIPPSSLPRYLLGAWLLSFVPAVVLAVIVTPFLDGKTLRGSPADILVNGIILAPPLETLLMIVVFAVLRLFTRRESALIPLSAGLWAIAHIPAGGLASCMIVWWPFVVFSRVYLAWEKKSRSRAWVVTTLVHALHNTIPAAFAAGMD